jgi:AraC-like DNA-binding protein
MFKTLILFLSIILGIISLIIIYKRKTVNTPTLITKYIIVLISIATFRSILHFIYSINPSFLPYHIRSTGDAIILVLVPPILYLYFEDLVVEKKYSNKKLLHFIIQTLLIILMVISYTVNKENHTFILKLFYAAAQLSFLFYFTVGFVLLHKYVWFRKSDIKIVQAQNKLIRNWTLFLYFTALLLFLFRVIFRMIYFGSSEYNHNVIALPILPIIICLKFILTPELQYGYNFLNQNIEKVISQFVLPKLWNTENPLQEITLTRDIKLAEKINGYTKTYIHQIENASFQSDIFRNTNLTIDDIAAHIKIPSSHINFVFKYHCNETFSDFKKIVRVHHAIKLLETNYLKTNTIESLSAEVGFITYNTFHVAFKNITGLTTQEYIKRF